MSIRKKEWTTTRGTRKVFLVDYVDQNKVRHVRQFPTQKQAKAFENQTGVEIEANEHVPLNRQSATVQQAGELWLETCRARQLEEMTIRGYEQHLRLHVNPYLGSMKVARVGVSEVKSFLHRLQADGRSATVIASVRVSLGCLLAEAVSRRLAAHNAVHELPKGSAVGTLQGRHKRRIEVGVDVPTNEEVKRIVAALDGNPFRPHILASLFLGTRVSELRGLMWRNVCFETNRVSITQRADCKRAISSPKSKAGKRSIPMFPVVANTLKQWKEQCANTGDDDLVFPDAQGRPLLIEPIVRKGWQRAQIDAGVVDEHKRAKYMGIHSARHWAISWRANPVARGGLGMNWQEVQEIAGHASLMITMSIYAHLLPKDDDVHAMQQAEAALLGPRLVSKT